MLRTRALGMVVMPAACIWMRKEPLRSGVVLVSASSMLPTKIKRWPGLKLRAWSSGYLLPLC